MAITCRRQLTKKQKQKKKRRKRVFPKHKMGKHGISRR
jgi:hypothetical protein